METLKIMDLTKEDVTKGDAKILRDLIRAFSLREGKDGDEKKIEAMLRKFIAFCSILPQAPDLVPNTMKSPPPDGSTDEKE